MIKIYISLYFYSNLYCIGLARHNTQETKHFHITHKKNHDFVHVLMPRQTNNTYSTITPNNTFVKFLKYFHIFENTYLSRQS
jgi:hypothetical protein